MTEKEKLVMLEEIMDLEEDFLSPEMILKDIEEWDSIAAISLIALMDEEFDKTIKGSEVRELETVADIITIMCK